MALDRESLRASAADFRDRVWPLVRNHLGGGELVPVESVTEAEFAKALDTLGMTDAWQVVSPLGIRGLATRVQWGETIWRSWTVRYSLPSGWPTEFQKLTMDGDWHRPSFVIQAYLDRRGGEVLAAACISTDDLREMLLEGTHGAVRINGQDRNEFVPVWWEAAEHNGRGVWHYEHDEQQESLF